MNMNINDPSINVYIYNIAKSQRSNGQGGLTDIRNVRTPTFNTSAKQKFNDILINPNQEGIIKPSNYKYSKQSQSQLQTFNFKFSNDKVDEDGCVYSGDILTTQPQIQAGGTIGNMKLLYKFYKHHMTKIKISNFINNITSPYYTAERIQKIIDISNRVRDRVKTYCDTSVSIPSIEKNRSDGSIIYNINVTSADKFIIFGDFHGSFHSFFRIFIRLHLLGVIDFPNYKINDGYKLIFLGDLLDRGVFSLEITYILFKFLLNNTEDNNLQNSKIIMNRGNHEEVQQYTKNGFKMELDKKLGARVTEFKTSFDTYLSYCSSAIILNYVYENNMQTIFYPNIYPDKKYWLSHGGIPVGTNLIKLPNEECFFINSIKTIIIPATSSRPSYTLYMNTIRWFDYITASQDRGPITIQELETFMRLNNIKFFIRGHTDDNENAFLLSTSIANIQVPYSYDNTFPLNNKLIQQNNQGNDKVIFPSNTSYFQNPLIQNITQVKGFVAQINPNNWYNQTLKNSSVGNPARYCLKTPRDYTENNVTIYPILTISTNSDTGRSLNNDSFIVFNFTNNNDIDFNYNIQSNILNKIKESVKVNNLFNT